MFETHDYAEQDMPAYSGNLISLLAGKYQGISLTYLSSRLVYRRITT